MSHEELRVFLDHARSRLSLVEILTYKGDRLTDVIFGKVVSVNLDGVELKIRGSAKMTRHFDFCGSDVQHYRSKSPLEQGWKVHTSRETLVFLELPQQQLAA